MKHKYKIDDRLWYGDTLVRVLRRLDNNEYQVKFSTWDRDLNIKVLKESDLSLVPNNNPKLKVYQSKRTVKFGDTIIAEERSMSI